MCGLVGVISRSTTGFNKEQQDVFEFLLFLDTLRGDDSTGVALIHNNGNVDIAKSVHDGTQFIKQQEYKNLRSAAWSTGKIMIGHNRKSTRGATNEQNAHPFWVENKIVLMHNGTHVGDHKHLADVEVDSHAIAHVLQDSHSPEEIEATMQKVNAAYALMWYDVMEKRLNILRNDERPLCFLDAEQAIYIASEPWMLHVAAMRFGIKVVEGQRPTLMEENRLFQIQINKDRTHTIKNHKIDCAYRRVGSQFFQESQNSSVYDDDYWKNHPFHKAACGYECDDQYDEQPHSVARRVGNDTRTVVEAILEAAKEGTQEACEDQEDGETQRPRHDVYSRKEPVSNRRYAQVARVLDGLDHKYSQTLYRDHAAVTEQYQKGERISVEIIGVTEADDKPKGDSFFLIGETQDENRAYVVFPFTTKDFDSLINMDRRSVFSVEVDGSTWTRLNTNGSTTMNDWGGLTLIHCFNPIAQPVVADTHHVH